MSKQDRINELKELLNDARVGREKTWTELVTLRAEVDARDERERNAKEAKTAGDEFKARMAEKTAKLAREQEALDLLKLGYVKVETLRDMILQDYEVGYNGSFSTAEMRLRLRSNDRVEDALRVAILEEGKPKFATGGYTGNSANPIGRVHPGQILVGGLCPVWGNDL